MIFRNAKSEDWESVSALLVELRRSGYAEMGEPVAGITVSGRGRDMFERLLPREDSHIVIAEDDNIPLAVCVAYEIPKILDGNRRLLIEELVVRPEYRGRGIGSALLGYMERIALERDILYVKVATGTKLRANRFYRKHGYDHFENSYRKKVR